MLLMETVMSGRVKLTEESCDRWLIFIVADTVRGLLGKRCEILMLEPLLLFVPSGV